MEKVNKQHNIAQDILSLL